MRLGIALALVGGVAGLSRADGVKWQRAPFPQAAQAAEEGAGTASGAMAFVDATFGRGDLDGVGGLTVVKRAPAPTRTKSSINKSSTERARD
jgi:hypothetical protein